LEDGEGGFNFKEDLMSELKENKELIQQGEADECSGSDDCESEDNLNVKVISIVIPTERLKKCTLN
jgi:hypothetical protein